jgi:hypothetical protein
MGIITVTYAVADGEVTGGPIGTFVEDNPDDRRSDAGSDHGPFVDVRLIP